jgi:hypothetical protein
VTGVKGLLVQIPSYLLFFERFIAMYSSTQGKSLGLHTDDPGRVNLNILVCR